MSILVDDTTETVQPAYGVAFELVGFKGPGPGAQGCRSGKRAMGSVLVVVPVPCQKSTGGR
jgi:hypothetical protein